MKLSRKGLNKIHCSYVRECSPDLDQVEFEQSDFEGGVVLSLDDVDTLIETMLECEKRIDDEDLQYEIDVLACFLGKLYKQAEGKE